MEVRQEYRIALEICPTPLMLVSRDGTIVLSNARFDTLFGYEKGELPGQRVDILVPQEIRDFHPELREAFFEVPTSRSMGTGRDLFGAHKNGQMIPVEIGLDPVDQDGEALVMVSVLDIRERQLGETKIRQAIDAASSAMVMINEDGRIELVNEQTQIMFGYGPDELIGATIESLVPERYRRKHAVYRMSYQNNLEPQNPDSYLTVNNSDTKFEDATTANWFDIPEELLGESVMLKLTITNNDDPVQINEGLFFIDLRFDLSM